jgi:hypothetical protein
MKMVGAPDMGRDTIILTGTIGYSECGLTPRRCETSATG